MPNPIVKYSAGQYFWDEVSGEKIYHDSGYKVSIPDSRGNTFIGPVFIRQKDAEICREALMKLNIVWGSWEEIVEQY